MLIFTPKSLFIHDVVRLYGYSLSPSVAPSVINSLTHTVETHKHTLLSTPVWSKAANQALLPCLPHTLLLQHLSLMPVFPANTLIHMSHVPASFR